MNTGKAEVSFRERGRCASVVRCELRRVFAFAEEGRKGRSRNCDTEDGSVTERQWTRVSRSKPCAICGKGDYCTRSGGLVLCMRVESQKPSGCKLGGWLHSVSDGRQEITHTTVPKEKPRIDWTLLAQKMFAAPNAAGERYYLSKTLVVKEAALVELGVGSGWDDYRSLPYSSWPERDAQGVVVGIVRRYRDGAKKMIRWSSHGLYYADGFLRMTNGPVFMPEGGSDTAAMLSLGLNVIGRPSNLGGVDQLAELAATIHKRNRLVVMAERDEKPRGEHPSCPKYCRGCLRCWPGLIGAKETAKRLEERLKRKVFWTLPEAKDVRAWLNEHDEITAVEFLKAVRTWK